VAITYAIAAYIILPYAVRMGLKILHRRRVPSYTTTGDGLPGDPVNVVLIGTRRQLCDAFSTAGWAQAAPLCLESSWRMVLAFVLNSPYPTAPFSTLYLFGRAQDIGFQKAIDNSPRKRHHIRFWALSLPSHYRNCPLLAQYRPPTRRRPCGLGRSRNQGHRIFPHPPHIPGHARDRFGYERRARLHHRAAKGKGRHQGHPFVSGAATFAGRSRQPLYHRWRSHGGEPDRDRGTLIAAMRFRLNSGRLVQTSPSPCARSGHRLVQPVILAC
jgi:hypothetical protein